MRVPCFEVSSVAFSKVLELLRVLFEYSVPLVLMWILGSTCVLLTATAFCTEASQLRVAGIVQQIPNTLTIAWDVLGELDTQL